VKDFNPNVHVRVFKATIRTNGETKDVKIINIFSFTFKDIVSDWCNNYMGDYPNYTFAKLQLFCYKWFIIFQNDEQLYLQLKNMKEEKNERVEVYYDRLLKLANSLQHRTIDNFLIIIFRYRLQPYLHVAIVGMKRETLQQHKEVVLVCEERIMKLKQ
jgi:hypothetical protein